MLEGVCRWAKGPHGVVLCLLAVNQGFEKEETENEGKLTKQERSISRPKKAELGLKRQWWESTGKWVSCHLWKGEWGDVRRPAEKQDWEQHCGELSTWDISSPEERTIKKRIQSLRSQPRLWYNKSHKDLANRLCDCYVRITSLGRETGKEQERIALDAKNTHTVCRVKWWTASYWMLLGNKRKDIEVSWRSHNRV